MKRSLLVLSLLLAPLWAQTLTLQRCIESALETHPDVKAGLYKAEQAKESVTSQKSGRLPQLSLSAEYDPQRTYVMPQSGQFHTVDSDGWSVGLQVRQKIYDFSQTAGRIEASKKRREISELSYEDAKALMRYRVKISYALLLVQKAALEARRKDLAAKEALYHQAQALYEQGLKTEADESRFYASVKEAEDGLAQARAAYEKARVALEQLTGLEISKETEFDKDVLMQKSTVAGDLNATLSQNLRLRISKKSLEAAGFDAEAADGAKWGSIDAVAEATHVESLSNYDTTLLGVRYSLPLYSGGKLSAEAQKARIAKMLAKEQDESTRRAIVEEYRGVVADLQESQRRIEARKAQERAMEDTKRLLNARYKAGLGTYVEVLDAEAAWLDARLGLLSALYARASSIFRLEYLNGK